MKKILVLLLLVLVSKIASSQIVICDTMPLAYNHTTIVFEEAQLSFGDSVMNVDITNNSTTNFAYPMAKLIPLTPLPAGMTGPNQEWNVFASSWNTGQTATCSFFFDVTQPIPADYTLTFEMYASNFSPLNYDTCVFTNTFTINLNPSLSLAPVSKRVTNAFSFSPNPAKGEVLIKFESPAEKSEIQLLDLSGKLVKAFDTNESELLINLNRLEAGVYYLLSTSTNQREKLVVIK